MANENITIKEAEIIMESFLRSRGMSFDALSPGRRERYKKVAEVVYNYKEIIKRAKQDIKEHPITIASVADATGISNKTFYNDSILNEFVKENAVSDDKEKNAAYKAIHDKLERAETQIRDLIRNAIEAQILKEEIRELERDNLNLKQRLDASELLIDQLQAELIKLKSSDECVIMDFKSGKRRP